MTAFPSHATAEGAANAAAADFAARVVFIVICAIYSISLLYMFNAYLAAQWHSMGFMLLEVGLLNVGKLAVMMVLPALVAPIQLKRPSDLVVLIIFFCIFLPTILVRELASVSVAFFDPFQFSYMIGMIIVCLLPRLIRFELPRFRVDPQVPEKATALVTTVITLYFLIVHRGSLSIVGIDDIYIQRLAVAETLGSLEIYLFYWLQGALVPVLLVMALVRKSGLYLLISLVSTVVIYALLATKTALLTLLMVPGALLICRLFPSNFGIVIATGSILLNLIAASAEVNNFNLHGQLAMFWGFRSLGLPSMTSLWYQDFFSANGYTYLSHAMPFSLFLDYPYNQAPAQEVAYATFGVIFSANAHFFATDGSAGFGLVGIPLAGALCGLLLAACDRCLAHIPQWLSAPLLIGLAFNLTNLSVFTSILTGGLLLTLLIGLLWHPEEALRGGRGPEWGGQRDGFEAKAPGTV